MQAYGTAEASRLTRIPVSYLRALVRARYVDPAKGPRGALQFSFHDLVVLRTARSLLVAGIPRRRVADALHRVRAQLPAEIPPRGLSVTAVAGRVVVQESGTRRDALSGQLLLAFEVRLEGERILLIDTPQSIPATSSETRTSDQCDKDFESALALEETDVASAIDAYRACMSRHSHDGARANLGRLLHLQGRITDALDIYRTGDQMNPDLLYNQAVALEDLGDAGAAIALYSRVLEIDEEHIDAHHNIARLLQQAGEDQRALRHWSTYRRLTNASGT